jgi:hypothetical protein
MGKSRRPRPPKRRSPMPKGSGAVRCIDCQGEGRADGRGSPIVIQHRLNCPQLIPPTPKWAES